MIEKRIRWRRIRRCLVLLAGLIVGAPAQSDSALTDENFGGVGGVYHVESETFTFKAIQKLLNRADSGFGGIEKIVGNNLITRVATDFLATSIRLNAETKSVWF